MICFWCNHPITGEPDYLNSGEPVCQNCPGGSV